MISQFICRAQKILNLALPQLKIEICPLEAQAIPVLAHHHVAVSKDIWPEPCKDLHIPAAVGEGVGLFLRVVDVSYAALATTNRVSTKALPNARPSLQV
jgi:hypothetical protein